MARVVDELGAADLYQTTGLQLLPFNTLFQLVSAGRHPAAGRRGPAADDPRPALVLADR